MALKRIIHIIIFILVALGVQAQETATVSGTLKDVKGNPIENANISIVGVANGNQSDKNGKFSIKIPANQDVKVGVSYIGYPNTIKTFNLSPNENADFSPVMKEKTTNSPL